MCFDASNSVFKYFYIVSNTTSGTGLKAYQTAFSGNQVAPGMCLVVRDGGLWFYDVGPDGNLSFDKGPHISPGLRIRDDTS
ncbi:MAG: hypothetical protein ABIJ92_02875 [Candidatus Aenigmatarchaeota archaeon]